MSVVPKHYLDSVVSIGINNKNEEIAWIGTGFFVYRKVDTEGNAMPCIVTNKHVIDGESVIYFRMVDNHDNITIITFNLKTAGRNVVRHPDPNIDIAVIALSGKDIMEKHLQFHGFDIDNDAMSSYELRKSGVDAGTLTYLLGFPIPDKLVNDESLVPICRLGCIARIDEKQIDTTRSFLADIQGFPGNSGGPLVNKAEAVGLINTPNLDRTLLIGIIHSYLPYRETLVNTQTGRPEVIKTENSGIAYIHPVEYIREVIDIIHPKITKNV